MKVAIYTLGCKVNQYETQAMEQSLRARGHKVVDFSDAADAYVVNTCSVTAVSDQKSRQVVHRVKKQRPEAVVAVCGCYPQTHADDVRKLDVDLIAGTGDRTGFIGLLEQAVAEKRHLEAIDQSFERRVFEVLPAGGMSERTRAMLKVEDGCINFCTYCIIPYARGPVRSLPLDKAAEQAAGLAADGYREIVLTGIEISSWGKDLKTGQTLIDLVEAICAAALPDLCPQFHLSMQSGCDATLKRMNRKYDSARFAQSVALLNQYFEHPAITTDMITGFPEETEEEFAQTLAFIRKCGFAQMHIFPYSVRPGTPAANMAQVPKAVKEERAHRAAAVAAEMRRDYLTACVGRTYPVLFEQPKDGKFFGHAPNYMEVLAEGDGLHNVVKNVRVTSTDGDVLFGEILED